METLSLRRRGFTLVELLVVIVIISILAGLIIPAILGAQISARKLTCANNLSQFYKLAVSYSAAHQGRWPASKGEELWISYRTMSPLCSAASTSRPCIAP